MARLGEEPLLSTYVRLLRRGARGLHGALFVAALALSFPRVTRAQEGATAQPPEPPAPTSPPATSSPPAPVSAPASASAPVSVSAPAPVSAPASASAPAPASTSAPTPTAPTARAKKPAPSSAPSATKEPPTTTDHERVVRRFGLGFIGVSELPIAVAVPVGTKDAPGLSPNDRVVVRRVTAPALGARIWLSNRVGIDAGLGFSYSGGATTSELGSTTAEVEKQSVVGFLLHAGAPIQIVDIKHMTLLVVPEATFGVARSNVAPLFAENAPPEAELLGVRLDVGVRAGAEIFFGFMGLPRLSLEAGIGVLFTTEWASAAVDTQSVSDVSTRITTTSFSDPWDILGGISNVSARYYF